jgi:glycosyltransferase involved in cell wall biosynthesis
LTDQEREAVRGFAKTMKALSFQRLNMGWDVAGQPIDVDRPTSADFAPVATSLQVPVHLLGRVPDVAAWLRRADLLVHPARWEGFGLALLEAMLASKPVVATNVSSIPEIVADGETGLLVPPDDAPALAAAVIRALDEPGGYGEQGRARAESEFSVARMADRTLALYERVARAPS